MLQAQTLDEDPFKISEIEEAGLSFHLIDLDDAIRNMNFQWIFKTIPGMFRLKLMFLLLSCGLVLD